MQALRRTPPIFAAVIWRGRVPECNAVALHSLMAELDAAGTAAALAGSQPAVSWCAPPLRHMFLRAAALYVPCASAARGRRVSRSRRRRCCVVLCFLECCFLGRETLGRDTTAAHTLTRHPCAVYTARRRPSCRQHSTRLVLLLLPPHRPQAALRPGAAGARLSTVLPTRSSCASWSGGGARAFADSRWVSRGTGAHEEAPVVQRSMAYLFAPPPGPYSAQAAHRASGSR